MVDISVRTARSYVNENQTWIAPGGISALRDLDTVTIVRASFDFVTAFPNGMLPSGVVLGKYTSGGNTGLYGKYDDAAADGRQTAVGFLAVSLEVDRVSTANFLGALMWHGEVIEANLPTGHGLDANGRTDLAAKFRLI